MGDYRDADDAVYELNGKDLLGERVSVEHARGTRRAASRDRGRYGPPTRTDYRVIVENLSTRVSWQDLKDLMRKAGDVTYADAHKDRRNEGVVEFASRRDMERALDKFDDYDLNGRRIKLIEERRGGGKKSRSRSRSSRSKRSKSRSKSKSRSRSKSKGKRSPSRGDSKDRDAKKSKSDSKSRSGSPTKENGDSRRSRSRSTSKNGDASPHKNGDASGDD